MSKTSENRSIGRKVLKYSSAFKTSREVYKLCDDFGDSVTDKSTYRPTLSVVKSFLGAQNPHLKQFVYDFPDGKDTNDINSYIMTYLRTPGLDPAEVDALISRERSRLQSLADSATSKAEKDKISKALDALGNLSNSAPESSDDVQNNPNNGQNSTN